MAHNSKCGWAFRQSCYQNLLEGKYFGSSLLGFQHQRSILVLQGSNGCVVAVVLVSSTILEKSYLKWNPLQGATIIIPISVFYYLELHNAITSYSRVQILLTKVQ